MVVGFNFVKKNAKKYMKGGENRKTRKWGFFCE
jgi:hypothetical protein